MRRILLCLTVGMMLVTTHRAPAPIMEESPTPAAIAKPRPKVKAEPKPKPRATVKPKPTPLSFAGVWATNFNNELQASQAGDRVTGLYDGSRGVLDGTINGNTVTGTYVWRGQRGIFRFLLAGDGNSFSGTFAGSNGFSGAWTGVRKSR